MKAASGRPLGRLSEWIDFVSYCRNMPLFIKRVYRDEKVINKISERAKVFQDLMQERINNLIKLG